VNSEPANAYVELAVVTDYSIYLAHQAYVNSTDPNLVILCMKIYFDHLIYAVRLKTPTTGRILIFFYSFSRPTYATSKA
jgi:hypothetical protein